MEGLAEALGVAIDAAGENGGEVVTPATETENTETVTDTTEGESGTQEGEETVAESQEETEASQEGDDESHIQTPEQRTKWAEMRREAERAKVLDAKLQQEQTRRDQFYADRFSKSHGIYTEAQYHAAIDRTHQEQAQAQVLQPIQQAWNETQQIAQKMREEGYGETYINGYLTQQMAILQAQERQIKIEQKLQQEDNLRQQQAQTQEKVAFDRLLVTQFEQLTKDFPDMVKAPGDISPEVWQEFRAAGGRDLVKAFKLANFDKLVSRNNKAAKQAALNSVNSKKHLKADGGKGSGDIDTVVVPPEVMKQFRALNKGVSDEEFIKFYRANNQPKKRR